MLFPLNGGKQVGSRRKVSYAVYGILWSIYFPAAFPMFHNAFCPGGGAVGQNSARGPSRRSLYDILQEAEGTATYSPWGSAASALSYAQLRKRVTSSLSTEGGPERNREHGLDLAGSGGPPRDENERGCCRLMLPFKQVWQLIFPPPGEMEIFETR